MAVPALFDFGVRDGPVDLVEIDDIHLEAAEAVFNLATNVLERLSDLALIVPDHAALSEDVWPDACGLEGFGDDLFRVTEAGRRAAVSIQLTPASRARWMASTES